MIYAIVAYLRAALASARARVALAIMRKPSGFWLHAFLVALWPIAFAISFYNVAYRAGGRKK